MKISNFTKFISVIISIFLFIGCFVGCSNSKNDRTKDIAVIYTGDVHCAVDENIGYAGLYEYKKSLINDGCEVILVDTGDAIQGITFGIYTKDSFLMDYSTTVRAVMWGLTPSYQYRKPSISTVWPISRA